MLDQYNLSDWKQKDLFSNKEYKIGYKYKQNRGTQYIDGALVLFRKVGEELPYIAHMVFIAENFFIVPEDNYDCYLVWEKIFLCRIPEGKRFDVQPYRISGHIYPQNYSLESEIKYLYKVWIDSNITDIDFTIDELKNEINDLEEKKKTLRKKLESMMV